MKKLIAIALAGVLALSMAACGAQSTETTATTAAATTAAAETTEAAKLSGTVTLAGSTSMQKLCEAMIESFEESYPDITVTRNTPAPAPVWNPWLAARPTSAMLPVP